MSDQLKLGLEGVNIGKTLGSLRSLDYYDSITQAEVDNILNSWDKNFNPFSRAKRSGRIDLRSPQIGALHAIKAHWSLTNEPATIVMPTGTGKTETMLSILVESMCSKVLVIVPSDTLREQTLHKFSSLGILPKLEGYSPEIKKPIVGIIKHIPKSLDEIDELFDCCNVVIGIPSSLANRRVSDDILEYIALKTSHLFIDEAHHITANQWNRLRTAFEKQNKKILQFTATPFRTDNKSIGGRIIYNYPLKRAFEEGYFKKIDFQEVEEYDMSRSDESIAKRAVEILKRDINKPNNYDHLLLARTETIDRAKQVFEIYKRIAKDLNPQLIYSDLSENLKLSSLFKVNSRESKIIVCVDMFGEGFDLPNLKIAALHDCHKSLPITLQFTGRFTRTASQTRIGNATVVANIALPNVPNDLQQLYDQDSDWNYILQYKSDAVIKKQIGLEEFIESFKKGENETISLNSLRPKMSTVVYKMAKGSQWNPEIIENFPIKSKDQILKSAISIKEKVLVIVEGKRQNIDWGNFKGISNLIWDLYLIYWDETQNLLFINSSNNNGLHESLAKAVGGESVSLIRNENIFRAFAGINRIIFQNVGLKSTLGQAIRYTMYTGIDVEEGLSDAQRSTKIKSNLFGIGFEAGEKTSMGCSYKGRVWSRKNSNISEFVEWCKSLGSKLLDKSIDTSKIFANALKPIEIDTIPDLRPVIIEWDDMLFETLLERPIDVLTKDKKYSLDDFSLDLLGVVVKENSIYFKLVHEDFTNDYRISLYKDAEGTKGFVIEKVKGRDLILSIGGTNYPLLDYLKQNPPIIRFHDNSVLEGTILAQSNQPIPVFDKSKIKSFDWRGNKVDIKKESQGKSKDKNSIQYAMINNLKRDNYDIVFDDDSAGEMADIVTAKINEEKGMIEVELFHCKFSSGDTPGARIKDLYEVCGQAQKSIKWKSKGYLIFDHLLRRADLARVNGFEVGNKSIANKLRSKSKTYYKINLIVNIVQPGLSINSVSDDQLSILGATEEFMNVTYAVKLNVVGSD